MTIIAVTGGRAYGDQARVDAVLDEIHAATPIGRLIHGDADGADTLAANWAVRRGIMVTGLPADWDNIDTAPCRIGVTRAGKPYNKLAGFNRNLEMLRDGGPDMLVVFPGGRGTAHCHATALKMGIPTLEVEP